MGSRAGVIRQCEGLVCKRRGREQREGRFGFNLSFNGRSARQSREVSAERGIFEGGRLGVIRARGFKFAVQPITQPFRGELNTTNQ